MLAAAWFTAIATGLLALFAIATAWYARQAFFKQSQEVSTLQQQFADQQEANRKQAEALEESHIRLKRDQAAYLKIAVAANHRLDADFSLLAGPGVAQSRRSQGALRDTAATERSFDVHLLRLRFPAASELITLYLAWVNQARYRLSGTAASSITLHQLNG